LLDFQYLGYRKFKEEPTGIGDADITLYKDSYGIERLVLIEMKKADNSFLASYKFYKKLDAISELGRSLSRFGQFLADLS
jgi:hypothetical protein